MAEALVVDGEDDSVEEEEDDDDDETVATAVAIEDADSNGSQGAATSASEDDDDDDDDDDDNDKPTTTKAKTTTTSNNNTTTTTTKSTTTASSSSRKGSRRSYDAKRKRSTADRAEVAKAARTSLVETAQSLPMVVSDTQVVRSFGRIDPRYATVNNIFPVGFSCDRLEFSPVHGRVLKMRCTILDGENLLKRQRELKLKETAAEGPLFRIMWGQGIDEDENQTPFPYDATKDSPAIPVEGLNDCNNNDDDDDNDKSPQPPSKDKSKKGSNDKSKNKPKPIAPKEGMRVRVLYDKTQYFMGKLTWVGSEQKEKRSGKKKTPVKIRYDDGSLEDATLPDPDIAICLHGAFLNCTSIWTHVVVSNRPFLYENKHTHHCCRPCIILQPRLFALLTHSLTHPLSHCLN